MATSSLYGTVSESTGLYGIGAASGGTYFEWFIFYDSATAPATPTGGSWSFTTNTGTAPSGWLNAPPASPVNQVWVSIAIVDSRSTASLVWSTPGLMTGSGLPILTGSGAPSAGSGLNGQLYINTATTPQSMYNKQSGAWVQLTGASVYATAGANSNITSLSGITGGISTATYLQLNTAGDGATAPGKFQWDTTWGGPQVGMTGGNVNLQIGQETVVYVYNNTGAQINEGQIVKVVGSQGQRLTVALAQANTDGGSVTVLGMATENIPDGSSGFVTTQGMVNNINTSGIADGTVLWLSPTTAGAYTQTKPVAPNHLVMIGYVVKGGSTGGGSIYIHTQNGYELDELHDVLITNVQNGNLLRYNSAIPAWVNVTGPTGTLVGTTDTQTLTNKTISGASNTLTNIGNSSLTNSTVTINGNAVSLGGSTTVTAATPNNLTFGTGLSASSSFNGSTPTSVSLQAVGTAGTYGNSGQTPVITVNSVGQVTNITMQNVTVDTTDITGTIAVAQGGTGASTAGGAMQNLLPDYLGNNGKLLSLNATGTALEWKAVSGVGTVTSVDVSGGTTGLTTYGGPITAAGTVTLAGTLNVANGGTGAINATDARTNLGLGTASSPTFTGLTLSGGTANGVAYLNGSKVLTTGSALTFDGTTLTNTGNTRSASLKSTGRIFSTGDTTYDDLGSSKAVFMAYDAVSDIGYLTARNYPGSTNVPLVIAGSDIRFGTGASSSEQMRLTSTGLGIGTTSPGQKLEVTNAGAVSLRLRDTTTNWWDLQSASYLAFVRGSTEMMRIDAFGNLGLGVTPSAWGSGYKTLQISARSLFTGSTSNAFYIGSNWYQDAGGTNRYIASATAQSFGSDGNNFVWRLAPSGTAGNAISFTQAMTLDAGGVLLLGTTSAGANDRLVVSGAAGKTSFVGINGSVTAIFNGGGGDVSVQGTLTNHPLAFYTNGTERARIDSSGNLLVANTSANGTPSQGFQFVASSASTAYIGHANGSSSGSQYVSFYYNSSNIGSITQSGTTAVAYNTSSDYRLKENIQPMTGALAKVAALKPCTYKWKADGSDGEGFIAHELQAVVPQCVTGEKDAVDEDGKPVYQGIDTSFLVATLTAAIQELKAELDSVKSELASLKG